MHHTLFDYFFLKKRDAHASSFDVLLILYYCCLFVVVATAAVMVHKSFPLLKKGNFGGFQEFKKYTKFSHQLEYVSLFLILTHCYKSISHKFLKNLKDF